MKISTAVRLFVLFVLLVYPVMETGAQIPALKEINYYPRNYAWTGFWEQWDSAIVEMDADLERIADLGANTVRIFLHQGMENLLTELDGTLDLIASHGLKAHVTLFDCWDPWAPGSSIEGNKALIDQIVLPLKDDERIAVWELKNEVDLGNPDVPGWVGEMYPYLKQQAGDTPCTVSVNRV